MHTDKHPLAGKKVRLKIQDPIHSDLSHAPGYEELYDEEYRVEDWWDRLSTPWRDMTGNPAVIKYAFHAAICRLPLDDEVVYGKIGAYGHLIHESELGEVIRDGQ